MEFELKTRPKKKARYTIGFLDENLNNEFSSQMMPGVIEAAQKYPMDLIRFAYYPYHFAYDSTHQVNMILNLISQFNIDGLLFLGWAKAGPLHNFKEFTSRFKSIPVLSIGTGFEQIPNVYFPGNLYIREIILHLINVHHFKRIAFVAPIIPDNRNETYLETMNEYGIYNPELHVSVEELAGLSLANRAKRALEILFDERQVTFDAIMSLYSEETGYLIEELSRRGFRIPQDIAVTSYEERDLTRYSSPELTTVYFPWVELGYYGCMKLYQLLSEGHIPLVNEVPGKVIYRNSCGCLSNSIVTAGKYHVDAIWKSLSDLTDLEQKKIISEMEATFPNVGFDFKILLDLFLQDFKNKTHQAFLMELAAQLRRITFSHQLTNIKDIISVFRATLLPYIINSPTALLWSGNVFQQAQVLAWEKLTNIYSSAKVKAKILNQTLQEISQILITSFSTDNLMDSLAENIPRLKIPSCFIFIFNSALNPDNDSPSDLFEDCKLAFAYTGGRRIIIPTNQSKSFKQALSDIWETQEKTRTTIVNLLHVTDEFMGFVLFEPGPVDQMLYQILAAHISTALRGALLLEKLEASYQKLAQQAHREGMADISIEILHNIGNILNSINVSVNLMKNASDSLLIPYLLKANELLTANMEDLENFFTHDPKSTKLMQFYIKLGESFTEFKNQILYNANRLDEKVSSIVDMISAQQNYAGVKEMMENLDISTILDDAIKLMAESLDNYQIKITKDYQIRPMVLVQRMKLFHILLNLISNAKEAMMETEISQRRLSFTIHQDDRGKYIRIQDSGYGLSGNLLEKVFEYGYTNPKNGHELGLHSCTKYMTEMGGKIWAESGGAGKGTTFVLQFS
jgi:signal transduction histidine kinase/DNA-binding LacI/PurR family transcriptional regulator